MIEMRLIEGSARQSHVSPVDLRLTLDVPQHGSKPPDPEERFRCEADFPRKTSGKRREDIPSSSATLSTERAPRDRSNGVTAYCTAAWRAGG